MTEAISAKRNLLADLSRSPLDELKNLPPEQQRASIKRSAGISVLDVATLSQTAAILEVRVMNIFTGYQRIGCRQQRA